MAKDDVIEVDGKIIEALPNATFRVDVITSYSIHYTKLYEVV